MSIRMYVIIAAALALGFGIVKGLSYFHTAGVNAATTKCLEAKNDKHERELKALDAENTRLLAEANELRERNRRLEKDSTLAANRIAAQQAQYRAAVDRIAFLSNEALAVKGESGKFSPAFIGEWNKLVSTVSTAGVAQ